MPLLPQWILTETFREGNISKKGKKKNTNTNKQKTRWNIQRTFNLNCNDVEIVMEMLVEVSWLLNIEK